VVEPGISSPFVFVCTGLWRDPSCLSEAAIEFLPQVSGTASIYYARNTGASPDTDKFRNVIINPDSKFLGLGTLGCTIKKMSERIIVYFLYKIIHHEDPILHLKSQAHPQQAK
jgi:hypothetical protein